ncbi:RNA polymerase II elongator complex subunit [Heterostelium album PN500]|uniref:Elongator complex protein 4 n=1 Tax=Heterostelium pallidum (strain ATCC 26659 / Pp 5 / PN500) TaxID=670386 RepID=D3B1F7_HETP5|nr:RNA polymerase II elongator complex subunit [Heterostelium album PN500]EFA85131.1 RNA polymerase II elongator complex subunit [Heterostelium album PN500]|eukprot:XP_020437240.1 RNA polymerase II elongator complex subunit [Heterostelium album PN500]
MSNTVRQPTTFTRKIPAVASSSLAGGAGGQQQQQQQQVQHQKKLPNGCKLSIQNGNLLTSTGLNDLDEIMGGGIPVGSILMIEEDVNSSYYMFLLKYFLAEGVVQNHGTFFSSLVGLDAFEVLNKLPARLNEQEQKEDEEADLLAQREKSGASNTGESDLKIAWRYQTYIDAENAKKRERSTANNNYCHSYDFTRKMNIQSFQPEHMHTLTYSSAGAQQVEGSSPYRNLFIEIRELVRKYNQEASAASDIGGAPRILRLALQSFATPLWSNDVDGVVEFLHALKGLLRSSLAVAVVTVPTHIYSQSFVAKMAHLCDNVVAINSFTGLGGETPAAFSDYLGLFNIRKIAKLNTLSLSYHPNVLNYVFKMKRRKMCIETIHLPPELSREGDATNTNNVNQAKAGADLVSKMKSGSGLLCSSGGNKVNPMDF